MMCRRTVHC